MIKKIVKFILVGIPATLIQFGIIFALLKITGLPIAVGSSVGYGISGVFNYIANSRFTFDTKRPHSHAIPRFVVVAGSGIVITFILMDLMIGLLSINYIAAQLVTTLIVMIWNFAASALWTFGKVVAK